jgi:hypothetical protein
MGAVTIMFEEVAARLGATGCTPQEIAQVEADQGVAIPAVYRAFLQSMGRDAGGLFGGTDVVFPEILGSRRGAVEVLLENQVPDVLPATAVVISLHQGYVLEFLDPAEGSDPPVRGWAETGEPVAQQAQVVAGSLLEWLLQAERAVQDNVRYRLGIRNLRSLPPEREPCPSCSSPAMAWSSGASWGHPLPTEDWGRYALRAHCRSCGARFWRWADDLTLPLQEAPD